MAIIKGFRINGEDIPTGIEGKSAYQIALDNGFEGTKAEWLASLKGEPGKDGGVPNLQHTTGDSETDAMSQKGTTQAIKDATEYDTELVFIRF